jgi:hypothetical protein
VHVAYIIKVRIRIWSRSAADVQGTVATRVVSLHEK